LIFISALSLANDTRRLAHKSQIPPPPLKIAEIMPGSFAAKSAEIIDSCVLSEIFFIDIYVNKMKQ
jgi:hypothetical protein